MYMYHTRPALIFCTSSSNCDCVGIGKASLEEHWLTQNVPALDATVTRLQGINNSSSKFPWATRNCCWASGNARSIENVWGGADTMCVLTAIDSKVEGLILLYYLCDCYNFCNQASIILNTQHACVLGNHSVRNQLASNTSYKAFSEQSHHSPYIFNGMAIAGTADPQHDPIMQVGHYPYPHSYS